MDPATTHRVGCMVILLLGAMSLLFVALKYYRYRAELGVLALTYTHILAPDVLLVVVGLFTDGYALMMGKLPGEFWCKVHYRFLSLITFHHAKTYTPPLTNNKNNAPTNQ